MVFNFVDQFSKYVKNWYFNNKSRGSSVDKNGASNGFNSLVKVIVMLTFIVYIEKSVHTWKNMAVTGVSAGRQLGKTWLKIVLNT